MRAAVIGATGFIGGALCRTLLERGQRVSILVRNPRSADELVRMGASPVVGGLRDEDAVCEVCAGADVVFNAAGMLGTWGADPREMEFVNAVSAGNVVRCACTRAARVVHVSTAGVSGPPPPGVLASEDYSPRPYTEYQVTKLAGEEAAVRAHRETGVPLTIVRPAFVYGPGDTHKLPLFRAVAAGRMVLVNAGRSLLHPVYVDDLVEGTLLAAEKAPFEGEAHILAGAAPASTREILEAVAAATSSKAPRIDLPEGLLVSCAWAAEALGRAIGKEPPLTRSKVKLFSENYAYTIDKARSEICYRPSVDLADGVRRTAEWYRQAGVVAAGEWG